jgi:hypothetical protein
MRPSSWLFVKGAESLRVVRPTATALCVDGPGRSRAQYTFDGEEQIQAYQVELAERLSAAGWVLVGEDRERRDGSERRVTLRNTPDRRAAASGGSASG